MKISELYTDNNTYFKHYMKDQPISMNDYAWEKFKHWADQIDLFVDPSLEQYEYVLNSDDYDDFYNLPPKVQQMFKKELERYPEHYYGHDLPTWMHMDLRKPQLLNRQTWLIHFSDNAYEIAKNGFKYGVEDMERLGLTRQYTNDSKRHGGYNFAFLADSKDVKNNIQRGSYGRDAVMFQNSGVHCYHENDRENQVVFFGKDVDPKNIILIEKYDGDWSVKPHPGKNINREYVVKFEDINAVIQWVQKNHQQYAKILYGF